MRMSLVFVLIFTFSSVAFSEPLDYTKIKMEDYDKLADKSTFTDKDGNSFRVENKKNSRGLWIQLNNKGGKKEDRHGVFYTFSEGKLKELNTYSYGKKEGLRESYYKGVIEFQEQYHNDKKHGNCEQYTNKGVLIKKCDYQNGLMHGKCYEYDYSDGTMQSETDYVDGKPHGVKLKYYSNGKLRSRETYINGKQIGKTERY